MREQLNDVCERPLGLPGDKTTTWWQITLVWHNLVSHANTDGLVWVSEQTQADETNLHRRTVRNARLLLTLAGRLADTDERRAHGVKVLRVLLPDQDKHTPTVTPTDTKTSRRDTGRDTGRDSGRGKRAKHVAGTGVGVRTEQNRTWNGTQDEVLKDAALKLHDAWQPKHRDDQRPSTDALLQQHGELWQPIADHLRRKYPNAQLHHLTTLLLDAAGNVPLAPPLRRVTQDLAADAARHDDNAPTLGATLSRMTPHLAPSDRQTA